MRELLHLIGDGASVYLGSENEIWKRFTQGHGLVQEEHMPLEKFQLLRCSQIKQARDHFWPEPSVAPFLV